MKNVKMIIAVLVSLGFILASAGQTISGEKNSGIMEYSGFLDNYPQFEADKDRKGALIYKTPGFNLKEYDKVLIYPIEIFLAPDSKYNGIKPDELKEIADSFGAAIINELEPEYPVVRKPGAGVLGIRMAITNVYVKKAKLRLLHFTPVGAVARAGQAIAGKNISLADVTIEIEMLDLHTNERLGVLVDRYSADPGKKKKDVTSWKEVNNILVFYAKRFRSVMDKVHNQ